MRLVVVINGQWSIINGQWPMANHQWSMVNHQWSMTKIPQYFFNTYKDVDGCITT